MKRLQGDASFLLYDVAPHAGAWIETFPERRDDFREIVAPHAGAWIETLNTSVMRSM